MKSTSNILGIILAACLMVAAPGCVVMDPAEDADYIEAEWTEELLDEAVEDLEQSEGAGDPALEVETLEEDPDSGTWPDPFEPLEPAQPKEDESNN